MLVGMAVGDLVVTDLDGTLWHSEGDIHPATVDAFHRVTAQGVPVLAATGRRRGAAIRGLRSLGVLPPAVVLNGALGVDLPTDERFQVHSFATADAVAVLGAFRACGVDPCLYVDHPGHEVVVSATPSTHPWHLDSLAGALAEADLDATAQHEAVLMFSLIGIPHGEAVAIADAIGDRAEAHLDRAFDVPGNAAITVTPPGLSKWDGVQAWCAHVGMAPQRVIALGDGPNDVELLTNADLALVPEVAHPAALDLADHLVPRPQDGGWATLLDHL
jgi:hydroxymethylpyrimidine pyrophosphatase-like HAD family hydrolase